MSTRDQQRQLDDALGQVRETLAAMLTEEARRSVGAVIERLELDGRGVRLNAEDVEIRLPEFQLVPVDGARSASARGSQAQARKRPAKGAARSASTRRRGSSTRRGRPDGPVRLAVISAFEDGAGAIRTVADVRQSLEASGVTTSSDNVHQQLRRLVRAGVLERAGRGQYRQAAAPGTSSS